VDKKTTHKLKEFKFFLSCFEGSAQRKLFAMGLFKRENFTMMLAKRQNLKHGNNCVIVCLNAVDAYDLCRYTNIHKFLLKCITIVYIYD